MLKRLVSGTLLLFFLIGYSAVCSGQDNMEEYALKQTGHSERIYIHYDRDYYFPGDTVWLKAYLFNGSWPSVLSTSLNIELVDQNGNISDRIVAPVFEATASGYLRIPPGEDGVRWFCRAYTTMMLSDSNAVYISELQMPVMRFLGTRKSAVRHQASISFLPEGGLLVDDLPSLVAFKASDINGMPVNASGAIKAGNKIITTFKTVHDGMGTVVIQPSPGERYVAHWIDDQGMKHQDSLFRPQSSGIVLHVLNNSKGKKIIIQRTVDAAEADKKLSIVATANGRKLYQIKADLTSNQAVNMTIPFEAMPTGIVHITLFNRDNRILAERAVFVNKHDYLFKPDISFPVISKNSRGLNEMVIKNQDSTRANLSISITASCDSDQKKPSATIISQLLLAGGLRGKIVNPEFYFENDADTTAQYLDMVMLTNGWQQYTYELRKDLQNYNNKYIAVEGKVNQVDKRRISPGAMVNIIVTAPDSSAVLFPITMNPDGTFKKDGLIFYGDAKLSFKFTD
ncbi:hypothetical protein MTO98_05865 [Mucilaginibacter sp. SMC90]|uniref:hypothetical protein n=1 Tax=Mucilaginibacter sp. SMC90 TaxID=2929803 RepID=UPI001FB1CD02|nr:hypothetical protein [Mucilaginibacter sp. SMC90]UOE50599.1 hypothetical protein MTO98_05865 [Mucilaginibacter sp. SMC90]